MRFRILILLTVFGLGLVITAAATPRLSATYGQDCNLCHVNPTGGGLRTSYVTSLIGPKFLTLRPLSEEEQARWPSPKISEQITIGTDLRFLYVAHDNVETESGNLNNSFFLMQGDVYLAFLPDPQFAIYLDKGISSGFEAFILARILPAQGYIKAGQFVPDVGWQWDNHTRYTREKLDLDFPGATDAGVEVGIHPGPLALSAGVYNGSGGSAFDNNSQKAVVARALYRLGIDDLKTALGGTMRLNEGLAFDEELWGVLAQAGWGRLAYLGDFYLRRTERPGGDDVRSWLFSQELDLRVHQGADVFVGYDFLDPDRDFLSGSQTQVTLGCRIYLRHFLKVEPVFRYEDGEVPSGRRTNSRFEILLHAFY